MHKQSILLPSIFIYFIILLLAACSGVTTEPGTERAAQKRERDNYVILLDLSDRLLNQGQAQQDQEIIAAIFNSFKQKYHQKLNFMSNDRIKVVIAPQEKASYKAHQFANELYLDLGKVPTQKKDKHLIDSLNQQMLATVAQLYQQATVNKKATQYMGANIWQYIQYDLKNDLGNSELYHERNHLFIITDGYISFESYKGTRKNQNRYSSTRFVQHLAKLKEGWKEEFDSKDYGLLNISAELPAMQVSVLEVDPKRPGYHWEILQAVWQKWAQEMGATSVQVMKKRDLATVVEKLNEATR